MKQLCESVARPASRSSYEPGHFTASAFVLSPERDALLLILHGKLGLWLQPGGHIDELDESLLAAARREVAEEVGLAGDQLELELEHPLDLDIHDIPERKGEPRHAHFDVRYAFRARTREVRAGSDAKAVKWVRLHEIDGEMSDESVLRAVRKLRARP